MLVNTLAVVDNFTASSCKNSDIINNLALLLFVINS